VRSRALTSKGSSSQTAVVNDMEFTVCKQINMKLHKVRPGCPIYDHNGKQIGKALDDTLEREFNKLLDATKGIGKLAKDSPKLQDQKLSLADAFELAKTIVVRRKLDVKRPTRPRGRCTVYACEL
jgi:hypothetical protein